MAPILLLACATVVTALLEPNPKQGLESRLSAMEHVVATLQSRVNETERDLAASRAEVAHLQSQLKSAQTETIAFEVVLQMRSQNISNHANLIFDTTPLNLGSHYNMFTGVFVSPFPAVYLLWANVQSGSEGDFGVNLMIDGLKKASGFTGSNNSYGTASLSSVNYLNKGTRVSFQHQQFLAKTTIRGNGYSSFGGVLIHSLQVRGHGSSGLDVHIFPSRLEEGSCITDVLISTGGTGSPDLAALCLSFWFSAPICYYVDLNISEPCKNRKCGGGACIVKGDNSACVCDDKHRGTSCEIGVDVPIIG